MSPSDQVRSYLVIASKLGARLWRENIGLAWTGSNVEKHPNGSITIHDPRPFKSGVKGMSDTAGFSPLKITQEMVGKSVPIYTAIEAKQGKGRLSSEQAAFIQMVLKSGGRAGVARTTEDVERIVRMEPELR